MNEQEMWEAVQNSDADYDGMFFYAVKTTGIFCRPSCRSKIPNKKISVIFIRQRKQEMQVSVHANVVAVISWSISQCVK